MRPLRVLSVVFAVILVIAGSGSALTSAEDVTPATTAADGHAAVAPTANTAAFFTERIAPILEANCLRCHGNARQKGHLKLNSRESVLRGGGRGPAIVVGDAEHSLLVTSVRYADEDLQMPPDDRLTDAQITDLVAWIANGAPWDVDVPAVPAPTATPPTATAPDASAVVAAIPSPVAQTPVATRPASTTTVTPAPIVTKAPVAAGATLTEEKSWQAGRPLFGKLHLLVIHFPVAALALALLAELLVLWQGDRWDPAVRLLVFCGTAGAVIAVATGTFFADDGSMFRRGDNRPLMLHEIAGWLTLVVSITASGLLIAGSRRWIFRAALLASAAIAGLTAHLGGEMAYGANWLF